MASIMLKRAGEGAITKAHRNADTGPTSGSSIVYEIQNCPDDIAIDDLIAKFKTYKPGVDEFEIDFSKLG